MRATFAFVGILGVLSLLCGCSGGGGHPSAAGPPAGETSAASVSPAASASVTANPGYARAAAVLRAADAHQRSVIVNGQKLGSDRLLLAAWFKSALDWEQSNGDIYSKAERVLQDALAPSAAIDMWNSHYMDADIAVMAYTGDRSGGADQGTLDRDLAKAKSALDQADAAADTVAAGR